MITEKQAIAYTDAFAKCYPGKAVEFKPGKDSTTWVLIDGDKGTRPLSTDEVMQAVASFQQ